jgi:ornithine decarboxylase
MHHVAPHDNFSIVKNLEETPVRCMEQIDNDQSFWIADFNRVRTSLSMWEENLSQVHVHYAMKCCDEPELLKFLADRGTGFDCASLDEIKRILALGVDANRIVFAHPIKPIASIKYAKEHGVARLVFDTENELRKILRYYPEAEVFLRVKPKFTNAKIQLSKKFGADPEEVPKLLSLCQELGANFIGFSFHVGSLCDDITTFRVALEYVAELKTKAELLGLNVAFIDIGGGFLPPSATSKYTFAEIAEAINTAISELLGDDQIEFAAEPGRFIGNDYMDLYMPVISVKDHHEDGEEQSVFIPDSIYASFNALNYDHAEPHFNIRTEGAAESERVKTTLWGQTCDSADIIYEELSWPRLEVGDYLFVEKFSAYTYSPTSFFNGFPHHKVFHINVEDEE